MGSKSIKKILCAVDYSDKSLEAAEYALLMARGMDTSLILLNVLETEPWLYGKKPYEWGSKEELDKAYSREKERMEQILSNIRNKAEETSVTIRTEILMIPQTKSVAYAIVEYAEDKEVDLIIMGTRGRSGIKKMLLGSVATGVVTYAHCPVMIVK